MNKSTKIRNQYALKSEISAFLKKHKTCIITLCLVLIVGLITGIFTCSKYSGGLELEHIPDENLIDFISGDKGSFGVFFTYFLRYLIIFLFIVFLNINTFFSLLVYFSIGMLGYILGFTVAGIITLFSFTGIFNVIIFILPFDLCIIFILILIASISIHKYRIYKKFGSNCICYLNYKKTYLILFALLTLILFIKCMLLPIIRITIIVI